MTGGIRRRDAASSLADRQGIGHKIHGGGGGRMDDVLLEGGGEAVAYPWVTVAIPRPPLTPGPPQKRHLLSILWARLCGQRCVLILSSDSGGCPPTPFFFHS